MKKRGLFLAVIICLIIISISFVFPMILDVIITETASSPSCLLTGDNVTLYANITSTSCIENVTFILNLPSGDLYAKAIKSNSKIGNYSYTFNTQNLSNADINWYVEAQDCNETLSTSLDTIGLSSFHVNAKTNITINPSTPDGLNSWYLSDPEFSLSNPNAIKIFYKWDSLAEKEYLGAFKLEDAGADANKTAGILELNYWSNFSCMQEPEQRLIIKLDSTSPTIKNLIPEANSIIYNNRKPAISAKIDDIYWSNSGINSSTIDLFLDGNKVNAVLRAQGSGNIIVNYTPSSNLDFGMHNLKLNATDNAGHYSEIEWQFTINTSETFEMNASMPENKSYDSRKVQFKINIIDHRNVNLKFINYNDKAPKLKPLCTNCNEYGISRLKTQTLNEGENNIIIKAEDEFGNIVEKNILLFIDSEAPKISQTAPKRNSVTNGSDFSIKYTENNLQSIILFYSNQNLNQNITFQNCSSGKNIICSQTINLTQFDNQFIDFYFQVNDGINSEISKETRVLVDLILPVLTINSPANNTLYLLNKVLFNIEVSEPVTLEYKTDLKNQWKRLCARCVSYGTDKIKIERLKSGTNSVIIRATDKAGNSASQDISIDV